MSMCGWGSRELTSKQGTFPLIMLLSFQLLDWAICSQPCKLGGEEFLCVNICLWQTGPRAVASCGRRLMEVEVWPGAGGTGQGWLLWALCSSLLWLCCLTPNTGLVTPRNYWAPVWPGAHSHSTAFLWPSHHSGSLSLGATITLELASFLGCPGTDKSPFW